ncbi:MAG TPA: type II secretion system protein N [Steroidobacteraceae bacterium]|nr:type II secretion system protein N [Steroidobacteraceae bacterium]
MPTSHSRNLRPDPRTAPRRRRAAYWPLIPAGILVAAGVLLAALPAAVITYFVPPFVQLRDLSGSIWHGGAGRIVVDGREAGTLEWRLHPLALLHGAADLDVHWVDRGISLDASAHIRRRGLRAHRVRGDGPIADLGAFGVAPGWRGTAHLDLRELATDYARIESIDGDLRLANLASPTIAGGANLGSYLVHLGADAAPVDGGLGGNDTLRARVEDTGGPLRLRANLTVDTAARRAVISGTLAARPGASAAIVGAVAQMAELRGRDAAGNVPIEVEVRF